MMVDRQRAQKAFRISAEGQALLDALSQHLGVTQTAVVELAIRDKAKVEGVTSRAKETQVETPGQLEQEVLA